jgi:hypothetical protein
MTELEKQEDRLRAYLDGRLPEEALYEEDAFELLRRVETAVADRLKTGRTIIVDNVPHTVQ